MIAAMGMNMDSVKSQTEGIDKVIALASPGKDPSKLKKRRASPTIQLATDQTVTIPISTEEEQIRNTSNRMD